MKRKKPLENMCKIIDFTLFDLPICFNSTASDLILLSNAFFFDNVGAPTATFFVPFPSTLIHVAYHFSSSRTETTLIFVSTIQIDVRAKIKGTFCYTQLIFLINGSQIMPFAIFLNLSIFQREKKTAWIIPC